MKIVLFAVLLALLVMMAGVAVLVTMKLLSAVRAQGRGLLTPERRRSVVLTSAMLAVAAGLILLAVVGPWGIRGILYVAIAYAGAMLVFHVVLVVHGVRSSRAVARARRRQGA